MPIVEKEIIRPGRYYSETGVIDVSADDVRHMCVAGNAMLSDGLTIPLPLEHQLGVRPMTLAEKLANTILYNKGWNDRYSLKADGSLWGALNVDDADLAKQLPKTVKFVSPQITKKFKDGNGKVWENVITHIALTTRPRFMNQRPFGTPPPTGPSLTNTAALSTRLSISDAEFVCLSINQLEDFVDEDDEFNLSNPYQAPAGGIYFQGAHWPGGRFIPKAALTKALATTDGHAQLARLEERLNIPEHKRISKGGIDIHAPKYSINDEHVKSLLHAHWKTGKRRMAYKHVKQHLPKWSEDQFNAVHDHIKNRDIELSHDDARLNEHDHTLADESNVRMIIDSAHVSDILAAQDFNKGKTAQELQHKWVKSDRFVLMEVPIAALGMFDPDPPGEVHTLGPIIVDVNPYKLGEWADGHEGEPETLVLDGQHRVALARRHDADMLFAYVGEKALPFMQRQILDKTPIGGKPIGEQELSMADKPSGVPSGPSGPSKTPSGAPSKPSGSPSAPSGEPSGEPSGGPSGKDAELKELLSLLKEHGIHLDEGTDPKDLVEHLTVALRAVKGVLEPTDNPSGSPSSPSKPSGTPSGPSAPSGPSGVREEPPTAVSMSLEDKKKLEETEHKLSFLTERLATTELDALTKQIEGYVTSGQLARAKADEWLATLKTSEHRLSLATPAPSTAVEIIKARLDMVKDVARGYFWTDEQKTKFKEEHANLSIEEVAPGEDQAWEHPKNAKNGDAPMPTAQAKSLVKALLEKRGQKYED